MSESLAVEAAGTGRRTGSCCCSCKSAISVGEARWSGPLELPQCRTAPLHCPQCLPTAPLHCLLVGVRLFYFQSCSPAPAFVGEWDGEWDGELRESRLEAWMKSHKSEVAIT